jgi:lipopolysaccharide transport system ATP-binding protein
MTAMADPAIVVERLSKCYRIPRADGAVGGWRRFVPWVGRAVESEAFWALRDVSFDVSLGQVVGIVGRNGSGKSTLLKILSRVVAPTSGQVAIRGRVGSLLEVGAGFHPELTGRENVYLSGAVLGMSRAEVGACFDEIVAFAEIERFLDAPVKRYSSGMYVRLAFAVAAHLRTEIVIVDEVLAVGDTRFQKRCLSKMNEVVREGRTVLFVSHNLGSVRELCGRGLLLDAGRIVADGPVDDVLARYLESIAETSGRACTFADDPAKRVRIRGVRVESPARGAAQPLDIADPVEVELDYIVREALTGVNLGIVVSREGVPVFSSFDIDTNPAAFEHRPAGEYRCRIALPRRLLKAGLYTVTAGVGHTATGPIDLHVDAVSFELLETSIDTTHLGYARSRPGQVIVPLEWQTTAL